MSDDRTQGDDELSLVTADPESSTDASTTEVEDKEIDLGEESEDKKPIAQSERGRQVAAWTAKVLSGEINIDALPSKQQWLKADIEKLLLSKGKAAAEDDDLIDARLEKKLQEKEATRRFEQKLAEVKSEKLSKYQKSQLEAEYKDLRANGVPKDKALEKALRFAQAEDKREEAPIQRKRMEIPHTGNYMGNDLADEADAFLKKPEKERLEMYKAQMKNPEGSLRR